jgi:hypothetical protein
MKARPQRRRATYPTRRRSRKGAVDGLTWKGRLAALPVGLSTSIAVYNQEMLQRKGVTQPRADWDMDQVVDLAKRLTETEGPDDTVWGFDRMPAASTACGRSAAADDAGRNRPVQWSRTLGRSRHGWVVDLHRSWRASRPSEVTPAHSGIGCAGRLPDQHPGWPAGGARRCCPCPAGAAVTLLLGLRAGWRAVAGRTWPGVPPSTSPAAGWRDG